MLGRSAESPVGVCGEAAADPALAPVLVGMGVTSLSMGIRALEPVRRRLAEVTAVDCRKAAEAAVAAPEPEVARRVAAHFLGQK